MMVAWWGRDWDGWFWRGLVFLALLLGAAQAAAHAAAACGDQRPAAVEAGRAAASFEGSLTLLADRSGMLTIDEVAAMPGSAFAPTPARAVFGYGVRALWFRLCLSRDEKAPPVWALSVLPPFLESATLYRQRAGGWQASEQGLGKPFGERDLPYRGFAFLLDLPAAESELFYLRLTPEAFGPVNLALWQAGEIVEAIALDYGLFGFYLGVVVLVAVINAMFWFWLRDPLHAWYAAALLLFGWFSFSTSGYGAQWLPDLDQASSRWLLRVTSAATFVVGAMFMARVFRLRARFPRLQRIHAALLGAHGVVLLAAAFQVDGQLVGLLLRGTVLAQVLTLMAAAGLSALRHADSRLYVVAFMPLILSLLVVTAGAVPPVRHDLLLHACGLVHMVLLNAVLARLAWRAERERQRMRGETLRMAREAEDVLGRRIEERTRALEQANRQLVREAIERKAVEAELQRALRGERDAARVQRQFLSMASHEFRTPLTVIHMAGQRLVRVLDAEAPALLPQIDKIMRNVSRMVALIDNLLSDDRLNSSTQPLRAERFDLCAQLEGVYGRHDDSGRVRLRLPDAPAEIVGDAKLLGVALSNLVDNALKYSPAERPVEVAVARAQDEVTIRVRDYGPGVPAAEREAVFEKYYRGAAVGARPGTGLGLHLARELARRHGGEVRCLAAPDDGPGACFEMRLPCRVAAEAVPA